MKTKKKSRFLNFCFSFLPGAAEMYMGFMKMGVSLMSVFFLAVIIPSTLRLGIFGMFAFVVWAYGFFHANHLAGLSDEEFVAIEDDYLFGIDTLTGGKDFVKKYDKWISAGLIVTGVFLLWNTFTDIAYRYLPRFIWDMMCTIGDYTPRIFVAVIIILIGIKMISGRKEQLARLETRQEEAGGEKEDNMTDGRE